MGSRSYVNNTVSIDKKTVRYDSNVNRVEHNDLELIYVNIRTFYCGNLNFDQIAKYKPDIWKCYEVLLYSLVHPLDIILALYENEKFIS